MADPPPPPPPPPPSGDLNSNPKSHDPPVVESQLCSSSPSGPPTERIPTPTIAPLPLPLGDLIARDESHGLLPPGSLNCPRASSPLLCEHLSAMAPLLPPLDDLISSPKSHSLTPAESPAHQRSPSPPPPGRKPHGPPTPEISPSGDLYEGIRLVLPPPRPLPPPPVWVILDCQARELVEGQREEEKFVASLVEPPEISVIKAERDLHPYRLTTSRVLACDPNTALLVAAYFEGEDPTRGPRLLRLLGFDYDERYWEDLNYRPPNLLRRDVPDRSGAIMDPYHRVGNIGLIVLSGGPANDYMVAELELTRGCYRAKLHTIRGHSTAEWSVKEVFSPVSHRAWGGHGVISYDRNLWWIDLSWGLLSCDPSADDPVLFFEPLPPCSVLEAATDDVRKYRYVGVSAGKIRFFEISPICLSIWTHGAGSGGGWTRETTVNLSDIWDDETYRRTELPAIRPAVVLLHPFDPIFAYFFLEDQIFGVDLKTKCTLCVGMRDRFSESFLPWILPAVGSVSTSALRMQALELLKVSDGVPTVLKRKLFEIVNASKVIEECMAHIIENVDKWPVKKLDEELYSSGSAYDDLFPEEVGFLGGPNTAAMEKIENVLSQLVANVAESVDEGVSIISKKIETALKENSTEKLHLIRAHYFSLTLEDIGDEAATAILRSGQKFDFLKTCSDRTDYLLQLELFVLKNLAMMQEWDVRHNELAYAWLKAAEHQEDDIQTMSSPVKALPDGKKA